MNLKKHDFLTISDKILTEIFFSTNDEIEGFFGLHKLYYDDNNISSAITFTNFE